MSRKSILAFFDHFYPSVKSGGPARSALGFAELLSNQFEITVVTSNHDFGDEEPYPGVVSNQPVKLGNYSVYYLDKVRRREIIQRLIGGAPDFIYLNSFFSFDFSIYPQFLLKRKNRMKCNLVLAPRGELAPTALSKKGLKKQLFLNVYRLYLHIGSTRYQASSIYEKRDIERTLPGSEVVVASDLRPPTELFLTTESTIAKECGRLRICLIARIHPIKNVLMAIDTVLKIKDYQIQFDIYGFAEDGSYYDQCKQKANLSGGVIRLCPPLMADEVVNVMSQYHLLFLPTQGENFGHSILESFIAGRPVLISNSTPWRGLEEKKAGFDEPLDEAMLVERLKFFASLDQQEFDKWCKGARQQAVDFFQRQLALDDYKKLFSS